MLSAEHTLDIQAPSISFKGTLENVYTKTECDEKFGGGGVLDDIKAKVVYIMAPNELYHYTLSCEENTLRLISDRDLIATFNNNSLTYFANTDKPFSIIRENDMHDKILSTANTLEVAGEHIAIHANESGGRIVLTAEEIMSNR